MSLHLKLLFASVFWGTTPAVGRMLAEYEAPFVIVFGRFLVAAIALTLLARGRGERLQVPRRLWPRLTLLGITGIFLHNGLMFMGLETTEASTASIILGLIAIQVLFLDSAVEWRLPERGACVGVIFGFTGTAVVMTGGRLSEVFAIEVGWGEALIFLSGLCWAVYTVLGRKALEQASPWVVTTLAMWIGVFCLAPFAAVRPEVTVAVFSDPLALVFVFLLGLVGSALGFLWFYEAVNRFGAVHAALYINLVPIFGVLSAALLVGETLSPAVVVGGLFVFAGISLVNRPDWGRLAWRRSTEEGTGTL